jgi:predicted Rossmann fold nucleotide-binding protein DprA/Smf involved in DNA uptake
VQRPRSEGSVAAAQLLDLIGHSAVAADDLARLSGMPVRVLHGELLDLEMQGLVRRDVSGGYVRA